MGSMERKILLGWGLTLVIAVFLPVYWLNEPHRMAVAREEFRQEAVRRGAELYSDHCASCHGDEGQGKTNVGPVLNSRSYLELYDDQAIRSATRDGRPNTLMAAYAQEEGGPLRESQIDDLVAFIRNWDETAPVLPTATPVIDAASLYARYCSGCHGPSGEGTGAVGLVLNSKGFLDRTDDAVLYQLIAQGRPEQGMPSFAGELSSGEINAVVALIRAWEATAPQAVLGGETLYARYCAFCHGADGEGAKNVPVVLNSQEFLVAYDDEYLQQVIAEGHQKMPPWGEERGGVLATEQIDALVAFLRAWETPRGRTEEAVGVPTYARTIGPLLTERCGACHGGTAGLTVTDYDSLMAGASSGAAVVPGEPEESRIVEVQRGEHYAQLSEVELDLLIEWIGNGASPEYLD